MRMVVRRICYQGEDTRLWLVEHVSYEDYQTVAVVAASAEDAKTQALFAMFRPEADRKNLRTREIGPTVGAYRIALECMVSGGE